MFKNVAAQHFSFHKAIIEYIIENPSNSLVYQKLIQTCKYIFNKNPVIVLSCLHFTKDGWKTCAFTRKKCVFEERDMRKFDLENLSRRKVWIEDVLDLCSAKTFVPLSFLGKIYRCEAKICKFFRQSLTLNQLLFVGSFAIEFVLNECTIKDTKYGPPLPLETIVSHLPKLQQLRINFIPYSQNLTSSTVKELMKLPHFPNIKMISLYNASEALDIDTLLAYLKRTNDVLLNICFCEPISDSFKNHLDELVDELCAASRSSYRTPHISYPGQHQTMLTSLSERFLKDHSKLYETLIP